MKTLREMIDIVESAQQPIAETVPGITGTPKTTNSKYAKLLASIAKERQEWITEFTGLPLFFKAFPELVQFKAS